MNNQPDYFVGIDVGASTTKAIIINAEKEILGYSVNNTGADFGGAAVIDQPQIYAGAPPRNDLPLNRLDISEFGKRTGDQTLV